MFQELTTVLKCEVDSLGYPRAALFGFCVAVAAGNVFAAVRAAHGADAVEAEVSSDYPADEIAGTYRGMMVALPPEVWAPLGTCDVPTLARRRVGSAKRATRSRYRKATRGPKQARQRRTRFTREEHISTAKRLAAERENKRHP